eukprot:GFUD01026639.1.p1 GENE.GFUD01026639.1~~GFUD01026639.1.p1  ORF type:complete len:561 (-),score=195.52 GFUD01026639.1:35-1717(-)
MLALSYIISLFKASSKESASSVRKEGAPTDNISEEAEDSRELIKKISTFECDEVFRLGGQVNSVHNQGGEGQCGDSEESGVEYESATEQEYGESGDCLDCDCDTLVIGDDSDDDGNEILYARLLQLTTQKQAEVGDKKDSTKEDDTPVDASLNDACNNICDAMRPESNESEAVEKENLVPNYSKSSNLLSNSDVSCTKSSIITNGTGLPTLSESVLSLFIDPEDENNPEEGDDILNHSPTSLGVTTDVIYSLNKPTAIVKPCQKSDIEDILTKHKDLNISASYEIINSSLKNDDSKHKTKIEEKTENYKSNSKYNSTSQSDSNQGLNVKLSSEVHNIEREVYEGNISLIEPKRCSNTEEDIIEIASKLKLVEKDITNFSEEKKHVEENNRQMVMIVEEFEKTISQLVVEKEREEVCQEIVMERIVTERDEVVRDHQNVERAFADLNQKYERAKEVVAGFQLTEDSLKCSVDSLSKRYTAGEEKYQHKKTEAEAQLAGVGEKLTESQRSKAREIARLTAQLRKAEMNVSSLEEKIEQKSQENQELTAMCDDLLARVETASY